MAVLEMVLPIFAVALLGYVGARTPLLNPERIQGLTNFVFYFALPAVLFRAMGLRSLTESFDGRLIGTYFGTTFAVFLLTILVGRYLFGLGRVERSIMAMSATFANGVMVGLPLVLSAFGEEGMAILISILTFHAMFLMSVTILSAGPGKGGRTVFSAIASLGRNPIIIAIVTGILWGMTGIGFAPPVDDFLQLVGRATVPAALFALGASLVGQKAEGEPVESAAVIVIKLLLYPALMWLVADRLVGLEPLQVAVATVTAGLPAGINVFLMARHYNIYTARASTVVLISTALSAVTLTTLLAFFI